MTTVTTAAPVATSGIPATTVAAPIAGAQANPAPTNASVATSYSSTPVSGGGLIEDFGNAISNMVASASAKNQAIEDQIQALIKSDGKVSPEQMSVFQRQQAEAETVMTLAKNMQDREERMQQIWAQPN
jgi:hypothetical protein